MELLSNVSVKTATSASEFVINERISSIFGVNDMTLDKTRPGTNIHVLVIWDVKLSWGLKRFTYIRLRKLRLFDWDLFYT